MVNESSVFEPLKLHMLQSTEKQSNQPPFPNEVIKMPDRADQTQLDDKPDKTREQSRSEQGPQIKSNTRTSLHVCFTTAFRSHLQFVIFCVNPRMSWYLIYGNIDGWYLIYVYTNVSSGMCGQRRARLACAVWSGPFLCTYKIIGYYWIYGYEWRTKARMILSACAGWTEYLRTFRMTRLNIII